MNQPEKQASSQPGHGIPAGAARLRAMLSPVLVCFLLAAVTLSVYWPVKSCEFVNYDDQDYVSENHYVRAGLTWPGVVWAFQTFHAGNWHPLTWLSHMLDVNLFGRGAGGAHFMNLLLHIGNTVLLFLLLRRLTGALWRSALVAALFALHPLHVESVAWISERKDVLSTFFGMLTLLMYAQYVAPSPAARSTPKLSYGLAVLFYLLGLMSKPMLVTWPFVMLLLDYWPLQRVMEPAGRWSSWRPLLLEKVPFFALSVISCVVTFVVQQKGGAVASLMGVPLSARFQNSLVSYARYLGKTFWPVNLAIPYPYPADWTWWQVLAAGGLVAGLCFAAVWAGRKRPYCFTGWFWFLGMLVPVIGLVQVGAQAMADRYTYVPLIGLFLVLTWGANELAVRWHRLKPVLGMVAILMLAACIWRTADQLRYWHDSGTLARHSIAVTENNDTAYSNLGGYLLEQGQLAEAISNYQDVLRTMWGAGNAPTNPLAVLVGIGLGDEGREHEKQLLLQAEPGKRKACADILNNLGTALVCQGKTNEGMALYRLTVMIQPNHALALHNLAFELANQRQYPQAILLYQQALQARPDNIKTHNALGNALVEAGRIDEAIDQFVEVMRILPDDPETRRNLGLALVAQGRPAEAIPCFEAVLRADPTELEVHNDLGSALISVGNLDDAIRHLRLLLRQKPDHARAHDNLGVVLAMKGELAEATFQFKESLRSDPNNAKTHFNLGNVLAMQRRFDEASQQYQETLRLVPDHPQAHCHLGAVLAETGRRNEARAHLQEALRLKPDYEEARQQLNLLNAQTPE